MEVKEGYKLTEVGVIPEDWKVIAASEVCVKIQDGTHFSPTLNGGEYLYLTSKNIRAGFVDITTAGRIDAVQHRAIYRRCDVKKGDLLLTKDGANTGNAALNHLDEEFSLLSSVAFLRFNSKYHDARYFLQQILFSEGQKQIQDAMAGNAITRLTLEKINKLTFPLPPTKAEQEAIAEALSDTDALIQSLEQLIAKKRQIKQGTMQELLTGKKRLPRFTGEWKVTCLSKIADPHKPWSFTGGPFGSNLKSSDYTDEGVRIIQLQNIGDGEFKDNYKIFTSQKKADELISCNIYPGDIILSKMGDPVARACIIPKTHERYLMCSDGIRLAVDQTYYNNYFINTVINAPNFRREANNSGTGSTRKRIGLTELRHLELLCPTLTEQTAIAAILSDMDREITSLETKLSKARQIKQGMMQELLTGKIRLIQPEAMP